MAQVSEVHGALAKDINEDGHRDLIIIGNNFDVDVKQGRLDAGGVQLFLSDAKTEGRFDEMPCYRVQKGEFREIIEIEDQVLLLDKAYTLWKLD